MVQHRGGDGDLGGPGFAAVETQLVADNLLSLGELALDAGSFVVAAVALLGQSSFAAIA